MPSSKITAQATERLRKALRTKLATGISLRAVEAAIGAEDGKAIIRHSQIADFARGHHHKAGSPANITLYQAEHLARYLGMKIKLVRQ
jgi:hypothetical protein